MSEETIVHFENRDYKVTWNGDSAKNVQALTVRHRNGKRTEFWLSVTARFSVYESPRVKRIVAAAREKRKQGVPA